MKAHIRLLVPFSWMLTAGLSACGSQPEALGDKVIVSGFFENWDMGYKFELRTSVVTAFAPTPTYSPTLTSAPINGDGTFSITLPDRAAVAP